MRNCGILIVAFFAYFNFHACDSASRSAPQTAVAQPGVIELRPIPAIIKEKRELSIEVLASTVGPPAEIKKAQFVDANNGWAGNRKILYRTSNAGSSWQPSTPQLSAETAISSFFFIDKTHGWLTTISQAQGERYGRGNSSAILVTEDGGDTWSQQSVFADEVMLNNVAFIDPNRGMAVGGKLRERNPAQIDMFILSTSDGGKTWSDISEHIKPAIGERGDYRVETYWISASQIYLLTTGGRVIVSENGGETWKLIANFKDIRPGGFISSTSYLKLLFTPRGQLRVLAGAAGEEGYWGDFIVPEVTQSWNSYELIRVPLFDALSLSEKEVLACGLELYPADEKTNAAPRSPKGIILYSNDSGTSWSTVHYTRSNEPLIFLTQISDTDFYAMSDAGNLIKFKTNRSDH
jgi:photosystem II stability/assembly factor-like uncharacterized protein